MVDKLPTSTGFLAEFLIAINSMDGIVVFVHACECKKFIPQLRSTTKNIQPHPVHNIKALLESE